MNVPIISLKSSMNYPTNNSVHNTLPYPCTYSKIQIQTSHPPLDQQTMIESFPQCHSAPGVADGITLPTIIPNPIIYVSPVRRVNFPERFVEFAIQIFNMPNIVDVSPQMLNVKSECPSGNPTICSMLTKKPRDYSNNIQSFKGYFKNTAEVGLYKLSIELTFSVGTFNQIYKIADHVVYVNVCRNYIMDCYKTMPNIIQLQTPESMSYMNVWGIACDRSKNRIYYTERLSNRVNCLDLTNGRILFRFENPGLMPFNEPTGNACDEINRRVLVCDNNNHNIASFSMEGEFLGAFGGQGYRNGNFSFPRDVAASPTGTHIAVTDSGNQRIQLFDHYGNFMNTFSIFENNPFMYSSNLEYLHAIEFGSRGECLFTTDITTKNLLKLPLNFSNCQRLFSHGKLRNPQGLVVDDIGTFLVADTDNNFMHHISDTGSILSTIRIIGGSRLKGPVNMTKLPGGRITMLDIDGKIHIF